MDLHLTRRGFVRASALVSAAAMAAPCLASAAPLLYGDGIHDDTDALERLFAGGAVTVVSPRVTAQFADGTVRLLNGKFHTRRPLRVPRNVHLYSPNCTYIVADGAPLPYPIVDNRPRLA